MSSGRSVTGRDGYEELLNKREVKMAGYWPNYFSACSLAIITLRRTNTITIECFLSLLFASRNR